MVAGGKRSAAPGSLHDLMQALKGRQTKRCKQNPFAPAGARFNAISYPGACAPGYVPRGNSRF